MYIPQEYQFCRHVRPRWSWLLVVITVLIFFASFLGYILGQSEQEKCIGLCFVPPSNQNDVHIYYGRVGEDVNISVSFKASPKTANGSWSVGNYRIGLHEWPPYWQALPAWEKSNVTWGQEPLESRVMPSLGSELYDYSAELRIKNLTFDMVGSSCYLKLMNENGEVKFRFTIRNISKEVLVVVIVVAGTVIFITIGLLCAYNQKRLCDLSRKKDALDPKDKADSDCASSAVSCQEMSAQNMLPLDPDHIQIYNDWADHVFHQSAPETEEENRWLCCLKKRSFRKNLDICWKNFPICNKGCLECCLDCHIKVVCGICGCCCEYMNSDGSGRKPSKEMPSQTMTHEWDKKQAKNLKNLTVHIGEGGKTKK